MKPASLRAVLVFAIVAVAHLARLLFRTEVLVAGTVIPMCVRVFGLVAGAALAMALWRGSHPLARERLISQ
jgi:hypothetical protein